MLCSSVSAQFTPYCWLSSSLLVSVFGSNLCILSRYIRHWFSISYSSRLVSARYWQLLKTFWSNVEFHGNPSGLFHFATGIHSYAVRHNNWIVCNENFKTIDKWWFASALIHILQLVSDFSIFWHGFSFTHPHNIRMRIEPKHIFFYCCCCYCCFEHLKKSYWDDKEDSVVHGIKCYAIIVTKLNSLRGCYWFCCVFLVIVCWYQLELTIFDI